VSRPDVIGQLERTVECLVQAPDPATALRVALTFLIESTGADMGAVFEPAGASLRLSFGHGLPKKFLSKPPLLERSAWEGAMIVQHPAGAPSDSELARHARLAGAHTWASLPIAYRDGFFGLLLVASRDLVGFSARAVELFSIVSRVLGLALYGMLHAPTPRENPVERTVAEAPPLPPDRSS
jgi:GAF domain-containing protein